MILYYRVFTGAFSATLYSRFNSFSGFLGDL